MDVKHAEQRAHEHFLSLNVKYEHMNTQSLLYLSFSFSLVLNFDNPANLKVRACVMHNVKQLMFQINRIRIDFWCYFFINFITL